jgi:multicomponent Na+:H+ antiporter subunit B
MLLLLFGSGLLLITLGMIFTKSLLRLILLMSLSSLSLCICYLLMDAPDVAMTEAALGSCLSTVILLSVAARVCGDLGVHNSRSIAFITCCLFGVCLLHAGMDMPCFGDPSSPVQMHINRYFLENTKSDIGTPSFVTAILASYRGFDTLGETVVILVAMFAVLLILKRDDAE